MFGGVIAILIAYGFYRAAAARHLPGFQWAFGGALAFYVPNFIWSLTIAKPMMNQIHSASNPSPVGSLWGFSSVFLGAAIAGLVYYFILRPKKDTQA
jgi:hypothetical protein